MPQHKSALKVQTVPWTVRCKPFAQCTVCSDYRVLKSFEESYHFNLPIILNLWDNNKARNGNYYIMYTVTNCYSHIYDNAIL